MYKPESETGLPLRCVWGMHRAVRPPLHLDQQLRGKRNIARFIIFILMLVISLAFIGTASLLATIALAAHSPTQFGTFFTFRYNYTSELERYCLLACLLVGELTSVFVVPVFLLCVMQIRNLLTNKTTFEKIRGPAIEANPIKSKYSNSNRVSLRNCKVMCSDRRGGSFTSTTSRSSVSELMTSTRNLSEQLELDSHSHPQGGPPHSHAESGPSYSHAEGGPSHPPSH